jgi:hypothetical protein
MKRLFRMAVLLGLGVLVLGLCLDWFSVSTAEDSLQDQIDIHVHLDKAKIRADGKRAAAQVQQLQDSFQEHLAGD